MSAKAVAHRHTFANGTLKATLVIPRTAKGKQLKDQGQAETTVHDKIS